MFKLTHIHLRSPNPRNAAQWYVDNLEARIVGEGRGLGDSLAIRMELGGASVTVSGSPTGNPLPESSTEYHWGLEHFGVEVDDLYSQIKHLGDLGARLIAGPTNSPTGMRIVFIQGPDDIRIELMQLPAG